jgi:hypothetical protein
MLMMFETHEMPASGEMGTHESMGAELEPHEMPTCGEIHSPGIMFAKLETHQTPTVPEIAQCYLSSSFHESSSYAITFYCVQM